MQGVDQWVEIEQAWYSSQRYPPAPPAAQLPHSRLVTTRARTPPAPTAAQPQGPPPPPATSLCPFRSSADQAGPSADRSASSRCSADTYAIIEAISCVEKRAHQYLQFIREDMFGPPWVEYIDVSEQAWWKGYVLSRPDRAQIIGEGIISAQVRFLAMRARTL